MRSALILLGGMATRAEGKPKYLFRYQGRTFLDWQIQTLLPLIDEIVLSCRDDEQCHEIEYLGVPFVTDIRKGTGPTAGIHAGSTKIQGDLVFITACDMPLIQSAVVEFLFGVIGDADVAVPIREDGKVEPLHAVYRRDALVQYFATSTSRRMNEISKNLKTIYVPIESIQRYDPRLLTFTNINDLDSLRYLQEEKKD
ncbi:MAG TPA: molybdenum cofactor guanylyltransferase [Methanospirillum sp.]|nr:molybdenum cofactor guanylyltransferase [Methanospirillum sp.]